MAGLPPPQGMTEEDYDSIHAAVVETVRGRWFLSEYARRSRIDEVQDMLAAIGRLEKIITGSKALPPPNDLSPHLRLLAQRVDEIAKHLGGITEDLRESGADPYLCDELDTQVRAIAGLPRGAAPASAHLLTPQPALDVAPEPMVALEAPDRSRLEWETDGMPLGQPILEVQAEPASTLWRQEQLQEEHLQEEQAQEERLQDRFLDEETADAMPILPYATPSRLSEPGGDPRLAALSALDRLSMAEKLALFS